MKNGGPLVSIVSPVYNAQEYVGRMLSSVLAQSHDNIEMICVDDGSTDDTEGVIKGFADIFEAQNRRLIYAKIPHAGQTAAVNAGLKRANGAYLSWVDSDDYLVPQAIAAKLCVLMDNAEADVVTSNFYVVHEQNLGQVLRRQGDMFGNLNYQSRQFFLALARQSLIESNCHLVRMDCFDRVFPKRELVPCLEGQNYQLMLPLYYRLRRYYIDTPLAYYVIRDNSHYHQKRTAEQLTARYNALTRMLRQVLDELGIPGPEVGRLLRVCGIRWEGRGDLGA